MLLAEEGQTRRGPWLPFIATVSQPMVLLVLNSFYPPPPPRMEVKVKLLSRI